MDIGTRMSEDTVSADLDGVHKSRGQRSMLIANLFSKPLSVSFIVGDVTLILSCH
jgi:hypothetical protein